VSWQPPGGNGADSLDGRDSGFNAACLPACLPASSPRSDAPAGYLASLETKDLTLRQAMIPLGSCTMKLNAAAELFPVSWPEFASMHPFAPSSQAAGYLELIQRCATFKIPGAGSRARD
jgi:hypothetical protein